MAVTIKDISSQSGFSTATVSKVLNGDFSKVSDQTRIRIQKIAEELNYRPNMLARNLVCQKSSLIGLIVPDISNPYYAEMCRGIADGAQRFGYVPMILNTDLVLSRETQGIETMAEYNAAGVIMVGDVQHADDTVQMLKRYRLPYMCVDNYKPGMEHCVYVDGFNGEYKAVTHLIQRGHREIAYISGSTVGFEDERIRGYQQAMADHDLLMNPYLVEFGQYTLEAGYRNALHLLNRGMPFTAIACDNDLIALGAFRAIREQKLVVPRDISLVGYDDVYLSNIIEPRMTTVRQPAYEMGNCAMQMLMDVIRGKTPEQTCRCFDPILVERDTVSWRI